MIGGCAAVLLALGACPNTIETYAGYGYCYHEGYTFDSDDDRVCSATTDGFDCCVWTNNTLIASYETRCYENAVGDFPCTDTLAATGSNDNFYQSRNCSDHTPASTTTPPAHACPGDFNRTTVSFTESQAALDTATYCCTNGVMPCYMEDDYCEVSDSAHQCCGPNGDFGGAILCWSTTETFCRNPTSPLNQIVMHQWCGNTPAQPADDSGLSTGAIAGISVGAVAFVGLIAAAAVCL